MSGIAVGLRLGVRTKLTMAAIVLLGALQLASAPPARAAAIDSDGFIQTNLVSNINGLASHTDSNLKNPWGIVSGPTTPWWVSDNNGNVSTLYDGSGNPVPLIVNIPTPDTMTGGAPTGIVFNAMASFKVTDGKKKEPSRFIFATEDGTIAGWSPTVNFTQAFIAVDNSKVPTAENGAVYKGLAIAQTKTGQQRLYATNFRAGTVDVYDAMWNPVHLNGAFMDSQIPARYAPFGIETIGDWIYVTYALQNEAKHDDLHAPHRGFVDVYSKEGALAKRLISRGALNSPWGLALSPKSFGDFGGDLLVGNFGDGVINAYDIQTGELEGTLHGTNGEPIAIDGLWGIAFGNDHASGSSGTLYFAAGINNEQDGLFGSVAPAPDPG